ncbi:MAG: ester cyclase [Chloroflexi bacterium]|nr:ester cyclase [Chloroflexota bacterium]
MAEQDLVRVARQQVEAFNKGDFQQMQALMTSDSVYTEPATSRRLEGPAEIVEGIRGWRQAFPDVTGTITSAVASGDHVVLEITREGTHTGPVIGLGGAIPPTNRARSRRPRSC